MFRALGGAAAHIDLTRNSLTGLICTADAGACLMDRSPHRDGESADDWSYRRCAAAAGPAGRICRDRRARRGMHSRRLRRHLPRPRSRRGLQGRSCTLPRLKRQDLRVQRVAEHIRRAPATQPVGGPHRARSRTRSASIPRAPAPTPSPRPARCRNTRSTRAPASSRRNRRRSWLPDPADRRDCIYARRQERLRRRQQDLPVQHRPDHREPDAEIARDRSHPAQP